MFFPSGGTRIMPQVYTIISWLLLLCLCILSLARLITETALWNSGKAMGLKSIPYKLGAGATERGRGHTCPGAPQGSARLQYKHLYHGWLQTTWITWTSSQTAGSGNPVWAHVSRALAPPLGQKPPEGRLESLLSLFPGFQYNTGLPRWCWW